MFRQLHRSSEFIIRRRYFIRYSFSLQDRRQSLRYLEDHRNIVFFFLFLWVAVNFISLWFPMWNPWTWRIALQSKNLRLPHALKRRRLRPIDPCNLLLISIDRQGKLQVEGRDVAIDDLKSALETHRDTTKYFGWKLSATNLDYQATLGLLIDERTPMAYVQRVHGVLRGLGRVHVFYFLKGIRSKQEAERHRRRIE